MVLLIEEACKIGYKDAKKVQVLNVILRDRKPGVRIKMRTASSVIPLLLGAAMASMAHTLK
jgi:hypothetical protein